MKTQIYFLLYIYIYIFPSFSSPESSYPSLNLREKKFVRSRRFIFNLFLMLTPTRAHTCDTYTHTYTLAKRNARRSCLYISKSLLVPACLINLCHIGILSSPASLIVVLLLYVH
ncbi:hypothetical protein PUN28_010199 [Cardiocondyla obscurior]|uniref:Secreted protein n=1 Tax=Cardiocondyla obscurior TaxID=286306 RepID=A0AAW2FQY4_9HYME